MYNIQLDCLSNLIEKKIDYWFDDEKILNLNVSRIGNIVIITFSLKPNIKIEANTAFIRINSLKLNTQYFVVGGVDKFSRCQLIKNEIIFPSSNFIATTNSVYAQVVTFVSE